RGQRPRLDNQFLQPSSALSPILLDVSTPILGPKLFSGKTDRGLGLPEGAIYLPRLAHLCRRTARRGRGLAPTITRPPGDRVIEVIGLFCLTRRSQGLPE